MRLDNYKSKRKGAIERLIKEKMVVLEDFDICSRDDADMICKLREVIARKPESDPRRVLDYYCKPIIQEKVSSWTDI